MAQKILQELSIKLSQLAGDQVSDYTANGNTIFAYKRQAAINTAAGKIYELKLKEYTSIDEFIKKFPMFNGRKIYSIVDSNPDSLNLEKTDDIKLVKDCFINSTLPEINNKQAGKLTSEAYTYALTNKYSSRKPSLNRPKFYEREKYIEVHYNQEGSDDRSIHNGTVTFLVYLKTPKVEFNVNANDILIPYEWFDEVLTLSYEILMNTNQG